MTIHQNAALILVDLQNDFCPGGSLAVPDGDAIIVMANQLQAHFNLVVATQDWHPTDHKSFAVNHTGHQIGDFIDLNGVHQILWPAHCVQETKGAEFHAQLNLSGVTKIVHKGTDKEVDSYSAFFDNAQLHSTGLSDFLAEQGVQEVYIMGLATDYCVKFSCLDAVSLGLNTHLIIDACRGIDLQAGDIANAITAMKEAGVNVVNMSDLLPIN